LSDLWCFLLLLLPVLLLPPLPVLLPLLLGAACVPCSNCRQPLLCAPAPFLLLHQHALLCCRVKAAGDEAWLMDSRGTDGQASPVQFETGMGEAPEACLFAARAASPCCLLPLPAAAEQQSCHVHGLLCW
jgi:hypothetical protein